VQGDAGGEFAGPPVGSGCTQITDRSGSGTAGRHRVWEPAGPGSGSITVREWGRRGASRVVPRGGACQPSTPWPHPIPDSAALARPPDPPQPVQLRRQRPGAVLEVLQVAVAVERPAVDAARPAAPVAGLRGARTGVVGPGPAGAAAALVDPRSGWDADLPGPARLPAAHRASPPLAWLQGSDQPSRQTGTTKPEPHGAPTVLPSGGARRTRSGSGPRHPRRGDLCWIVSVGGCGSQAGRSAPAGRCARGEAQPPGILNWQLSP